MTASAPIVTIIVPGRDIAPFAPAALASLQAQTEPRWRAILVDDGSSDDTGRIFADAADSDPRFTVISHEASRGLGAARNVALDRVDTALLGFLDADDELTPTALARLTGTLARTGSCALLCVIEVPSARTRQRTTTSGMTSKARARVYISCATI